MGRLKLSPECDDMARESGHSRQPGSTCVINVREVLQNHSTTTTLAELEARGRSKVRVINASEISRLIEQAIQQTLASAGGSEGMEELVARTKTEFAELKRQRDAEAAARAEGLEQLKAAREELIQLGTHVEELQSMERAVQEKLRASESSLLAERARVDELRKLVDILTKERDLAREAERESRRAADEARAAAPPPNTDLLAQLAAQVAKLSEKIDAAPQPVAAEARSAPSPEMLKMEERLEKLSTGISDRLEKFGRSMGVSSAVEVENVSYTGIFNQDEKLESNVDALEVKERKAGGIAGALERMKKMKLGDE